MTMPWTAATYPGRRTDDLIVITGAGGFIAGALTRYFRDQGFTRIRAIDRKPLPDWYQRVPGVECLSLDLSEPDNCRRAVDELVLFLCSDAARAITGSHYLIDGGLLATAPVILKS